MRVGEADGAAGEEGHRLTERPPGGIGHQAEEELIRRRLARLGGRLDGQGHAVGEHEVEQAFHVRDALSRQKADITGQPGGIGNTVGLGPPGEH